MSALTKATARRRYLAAGLAALIIGAGGVALTATPALAAGSDAETPYTVSASGVTMPAGMTYADGGHVNVRTNQGHKGIHFESLNNQPSGKWIGESFLPWEAFGFDSDTLCVEWVQVGEFNEHFGEGGQEPVGNGCEARPVDPETPVDPVDPTDPTDPVEPTDPVNPTDPVEPTEPVDPVDPTDPMTPLVPTDPTDPEIPTDPTDPSDPITPLVPTDPTDPEIPTDPTDPTDPEIPALPLTDGGTPFANQLAATGQDALALALTGGAALILLVGGAGVAFAARRRAA